MHTNLMTTVLFWRHPVPSAAFASINTPSPKKNNKHHVQRLLFCDMQLPNPKFMYLSPKYPCPSKQLCLAWDQPTCNVGLLDRQILLYAYIDPVRWVPATRRTLSAACVLSQFCCHKSQRKFVADYSSHHVLADSVTSPTIRDRIAVTGSLFFVALFWQLWRHKINK